jgi:hypothetical protein
MKRSMTIRLFIGTLVIALSLILFSYVHSRSSQDDPNGESGKCEGCRTQNEFILWESLTHNFLIGKR